MEMGAEPGPGDFKYNISACLFDDDLDIKIATRNNLPQVFKGIFDFKDKIGDSGPTVHAEIFALQSGLKCAGLSIAITDPPCPNCTKLLIMSGIKNVYILESGFTHGLWYNSVDENDVARRRYFDEVSLALLKHAGLGVFKIKHNDQGVEILSEPDSVSAHRKHTDNANYAFIKNEMSGETRLYEQYTYGMSAEKAENIRASFKDVAGGLRYRLMIDPLSHLLAHSAQRGKTLASQTVHITEIPTSRCIVNAVSAGVVHLFVPQEYELHYKEIYENVSPSDLSKKTVDALNALKVLEGKGAVKVTFERFKQTD